MADIILENAVMRLIVGENCITKSLILKETGEELLAAEEEIALFSVTQDRPFNNEVKLAHPNKRTTYQANHVIRVENKLYVSFETVPVKAVIDVVEAPGYLSFRLHGFTVYPEDYRTLCMKTPPVAELRLCQLPVRHRKNFGEWLNVVWDDTAAVNVLADSPYPRIECEYRKSCRILTADAVRGIKLEGCSATLIVSRPDKLLDCIDAMERDYGLPHGVESRRSDSINQSVYWTHDLHPDNVDEHIAFAKRGGFRLMLIYYTSMFHEDHGYGFDGDYDYNEYYPNGREDLIRVLDRIKAAGIQPGIHFLQTHIGLWSRYVTPHADHRLGKTRYFTLSRPLADGDTELYVEENPEGCVLHPRCRILQFGGELISYENYVDEPPYRFTGIQRGAMNTEPEAHATGQIGGLLDISEFGATSVYINQNSSLQDEIADKIADAYNCGFRFCYMDGSEGTNVPFEFHVPNAQYRVYKKFKEAPLFTEGAAKAHFSWHFQSGGNAFDIWPPKIFKKTIAEFPAEEAPRMRCDFTRLDFGWWGFWAPNDEDNGIQADMYEYGTSRAAAWDCPATIQADLGRFRAHPRIDDILEVMRRWEDVRATHWLTGDQKLALRDLAQEHTLLINEKGEYELAAYRKIDAPSGISAFVFEREGARWVVYWHETGEGSLELPLGGCQYTVSDAIGGEPLAVPSSDGASVIPAGAKRYLRTELSEAEIVRAFADAKLR
ncbi:MAG: hypothetical protein SOW68_07550 [Eubacteriales bacterium]|nr:hypothetical protein [Eubacteriales bacterium]